MVETNLESIEILEATMSRRSAIGKAIATGAVGYGLTASSTYAAGSYATTRASRLQDAAGGFDLIVASGADPVSLDPRKTFVGPGYSINAHVFESLAFRRDLEDGSVEVYPVLAESWEHVDDVTLEIKLRQGVFFHNGVELTADAVAFTINTIMDPDFVTSLKTWTSNIESVEVVDAYTVHIKTPTPVRGLINSMVQIPIVEPGAVESLGDRFDLEPVGTGPYRIVSYSPNSSVEMEHYEDYWGEPGLADKITFRILPENATRLAALQAGEVDIAEAIPPDKVEEINASDNLAVSASTTMRVDFLVPVFTSEIMNDLNFRKAISLAVDRVGIVDGLLSSSTSPANSISPPGTIGYDWDAEVYPFDPELAAQMLAESSYDGQEIKMGGPSGRYIMDRQICEAIAAMLQEIGINVTLEILEWSAYTAARQAGTYDLFYIGITDFTVNPVQHWGIFHTPRSSPYGSYSNPEMDAIINEAIQTLDDEAAAVLFLEGQAFQREDLGAIPLHYEPQLIGTNNRISGFTPRLDEYVIVTNVSKNES